MREAARNFFGFLRRFGAALLQRRTKERKRNMTMNQASGREQQTIRIEDVGVLTVATGQAIEVFSYEGDEGGGFENQTMADRKLPMIALLQSNSPQVVESKGKLYAGQFLNTVTGETYDEIAFVPAITDHCFVQYVPRDDGGGFRGRHPKDSKVVVDAIARNGGRSIGKLPVPMPPDPKTMKPQPTNELVETFEVYAILYDKQGVVAGFACISFASTKIKVYRGWNSQLAGFSPTVNGKKIPAGVIPLFAHCVKMTSESETRNGNTYMIPVLAPANGGDDLKGSLIGKQDARYVAAKQLRDDVRKGLAKAAYETMAQEAGPDPEAPAPF